MPDWKTILVLAALTGGTNFLQYLGITAPTQTAKTEVAANSDFMRDELNACLGELKKCYAQCGSRMGSANIGSTDFYNWEAEAPFPAQIAK